MVTLLSEIHFWSTQDEILVKNTDYGAFKYSSKKDTADLYSASKKLYCERRDLSWTVPNKRPHKLKDKLKELEEHLLQNRVVSFSWQDSSLLVLLSKGVIVNVTYNLKTLDIVAVYFDKYLTTKIQNETISDGIIQGQRVIVICGDGRAFGHGKIWKDGWTIEGGPRRYINTSDEYLAVWGRSGAEHPQPWSPLTRDHQRANLHLYWLGSREPELLAYKKTSAEPLHVSVSKIFSKSVIVVEQKVSQRGAVSVEVYVLELISNNLKRASVTAVPLQTQVSCTSISKDENFVLLGCIDSSVALLDRSRGSTKILKTPFIPILASWHLSGCLTVLANERGQLLYVDTALNFVKSQVVCEDPNPSTLVDISSYFNCQLNVTAVNWGPTDVVLALEHGPLVVVTHVHGSLGFTPLIRKYLYDNKLEFAVNLLLSWEFNEECFGAVQRIVAHLMKLPLNEETAKLLQDSLGAFYSPPVPLNVDIVHRYGFQVKALTRRFFHQLVRLSMFETAFLLAVDIGHHDLFMDLHYVAVQIGETEMAAAAKAQASTLLSQCSSAASVCSRSSCSQCSETTSSGSDSEEFSSPENIRKSYRSQQISNDNYLTTNFNNTNPRTYGAPASSTTTYVPPVPHVDLPKVNFDRSNKNKVVTYNRSSNNVNLNAPPLPVTSPPVPTSTYLGQVRKPDINTILSYTPPPLPFSNLHTRPIVTLASEIPSLSRSNSRHKSQFTDTFYTNEISKLSQLSIRHPPLPDNTLTNFNNFNTTVGRDNLPITNIPSYSSSGSNVVATEIVTESPSTVGSTLSSNTTVTSSSGATNKKAQAKVKFSDTVTAFIVPEIKRPVRPPLPAHVMDPQKELADSLPLCHPNEDYLKDFAPVRRNETPDTPAPKIKVVHFGVV